MENKIKKRTIKRVIELLDEGFDVITAWALASGTEKEFQRNMRAMEPDNITEDWGITLEDVDRKCEEELEELRKRRKNGK